jgi:ADP-ribose pyrophosphatase YjhB (NUDIX family)
MNHETRWVGWARKLQAVAQTGLHFAQSNYDRERYQSMLDLSVEIFAEYSGESGSIIKQLFQNQTGYATPKVDVRGVVFRANKLLLVKEIADGLWTLPGGWADVNDAPSEAVEREIREESGFNAKAERLLAVFDRSKHPHDPPFPFHVYKLFIGCRLEGGESKPTLETSAADFFAQNEIPPLSTSRVTPEQISFCFEMQNRPDTPARFD